MINQVILGDCFQELPKIQDNSIDLIITDPPYSLNYDFENDKLNYNQQSDLMKKYCFQFKRIIKNNGTICIFMSQEMSHYLYFVLLNNGFIWQNEIIWNRDGGQMPIKKLGICHEIINIWTNGKEHKTFNLDEIRVQSKYASTDKRLNPKGKNPGDVWYVPALFGKKLERITGDDGKAIHPTQKPLNIILPLIIAYSNKDDLILDCFAGSGSTGLAAKNLNRQFILIEKEQKYYDVILERLKS